MGNAHSLPQMVGITKDDTEMMSFTLSRNHYLPEALNSGSALSPLKTELSGAKKDPWYQPGLRFAAAGRTQAAKNPKSCLTVWFTVTIISFTVRGLVFAHMNVSAVHGQSSGSQDVPVACTCSKSLTAVVLSSLRMSCVYL